MMEVNWIGIVSLISFFCGACLSAYCADRKEIFWSVFYGFMSLFLLATTVLERVGS